MSGVFEAERGRCSWGIGGPWNGKAVSQTNRVEVEWVITDSDINVIIEGPAGY